MVLFQWCPVQCVVAMVRWYCNHVMALMVEVADYYLGGFRKVHEEKACKSVAKQWRIPGIKNLPETPVCQLQ